jgi:hypothetical protein
MNIIFETQKNKKFEPKQIMKQFFPTSSITIN